MRFRLIVEYDGTEFCGWQVQPNARSIQGVLEEALTALLGRPTRIRAAGRTDAGVHAEGQVVSFQTEKSIPPEVVCRALNALTPCDVAVREVELVDEGFDPRRHARSRVYVYRIWNRPVPSPFWRRWSWHIPRGLEIAEMGRAAQALAGEHDFTSFRAADCDASHPVRRVISSEFHTQGPLLEYRIEATAFLRHMVRNIVGTLVEVGRGARPADDVPRLLEARDRAQAGATCPALGLCLVEVKYGGD